MYPKCKYLYIFKNCLRITRPASFVSLSFLKKIYTHSAGQSCWFWACPGVPQVHVGDRPRATDVLRHELVGPGPPNLLHLRLWPPAARRRQLVSPLSSVPFQTFLMLKPFISLFSSVMQKAWRERNPQARISAAHEALELEEYVTLFPFILQDEGMGEKKNIPN